MNIFSIAAYFLLSNVVITFNVQHGCVFTSFEDIIFMKFKLKRK